MVHVNLRMFLIRSKCTVAFDWSLHACENLFSSQSFFFFYIHGTPLIQFWLFAWDWHTVRNRDRSEEWAQRPKVLGKWSSSRRLISNRSPSLQFVSSILLFRRAMTISGSSNEVYSFGPELSCFHLLPQVCCPMPVTSNLLPDSIAQTPATWYTLNTPLTRLFKRLLDALTRIWAERIRFISAIIRGYSFEYNLEIRSSLHQTIGIIWTLVSFMCHGFSFCPSTCGH